MDTALRPVVRSCWHNGANAPQSVILATQGLAAALNESTQIYDNISIMNRLVSIGEAAKTLGVSITTLRRWEAAGKLSAEHTAGGHRRYDLAKLRPELYHAG
ncbi:MAG: helix-turn-helix domain-containing protein, partial [Giesbergeria sp.]|uniref:MerR family transcriptional regulator n=1 Tax=Giesbergeria sp. TaxID=2818473 RepID=UPI0026182967